MVWGKAGSTTTTANGDTVSVTSMSENDTLQCMSHITTSGTFGVYVQYNDDSSGSDYNGSYQTNGSGRQTFRSNQLFSLLDNSGGTSMSGGDFFSVSYIMNLENEEKLVIGFSNMANGTGTTTLKRNQMFGKFVTNDKITSVSNTNVSAGDYLTDSNLTVLGSDLTPASAQDVTVTDGAIFYETDTNKEYVLYNNTWTEL